MESKTVEITVLAAGKEVPVKLALQVEGIFSDYLRELVGSFVSGQLNDMMQHWRIHQPNPLQVVDYTRQLQGDVANLSDGISLNNIYFPQGNMMTAGYVIGLLGLNPDSAAA